MRPDTSIATVLKQGVTLYLIRHGETDWNKAQRYQGQRDIPLNDTGRAQAKRNGSVLRDYLPDIAAYDFVSSPLSRAIETMELVRAGMGLDPAQYRVSSDVRELHYGHWEGELASELPLTDPKGLADKAADPFHWQPRGGESYADLMRRIRPWIASLERDTVAVTHGGVSRVARGAILSLPEQDVPTLEVPQDRVLVLRNAAMQWL